MTSLTHRITGDVDTHLDVHVATALDELGALLGTESFPATAAGYRRLLAWLRSFGVVELVGVEGIGSYGAGLTRHLHAEGISAARAAQSGDANGAAKTRNGNVEMMRVLRLVKLSARRGRTVALNQIRSIVATGPEELRARFRDLPAGALIAQAAALRPAVNRDVLAATKIALRQLARRAQAFRDEIDEINALLEPLGTIIRAPLRRRAPRRLVRKAETPPPQPLR